MWCRRFIEIALYSAILISVSGKLIEETQGSSWFGPEFGILHKLYDDCHDKNDFAGCLKGKALNALTKAIEQDSITIMDGVVLEKQNSTDVVSTPSITTPKALNGLSGIDRVLMQKLDTFLRTHVLKMDMSEGREKKKDKKKKKHKKHSYHKHAMSALIVGMGLAGPIGLKVLGMVATKALVLSKVALTIATIIALKKLFSKDEHDESESQDRIQDEYLRRNAYTMRPITASSEVPTNQYDPYRFYNMGQSQEGH